MVLRMDAASRFALRRSGSDRFDSQKAEKPVLTDLHAPPFGDIDGQLAGCSRGPSRGRKPRAILRVRTWDVSEGAAPAGCQASRLFWFDSPPFSWDEGRRFSGAAAPRPRAITDRASAGLGMAKLKESGCGRMPGSVDSAGADRELKQRP